MANNNRFERQIRLFGKDGQDKLARLRACIVGVGGLGSHLVQQFALLGLGRITVIDPDVVDVTNMNRLIGARFDDPYLRTPKVVVAERLSKSIDPHITVDVLKEHITTSVAFTAVRESNYVFGCVDHDGPRMVLTELCLAYKIPYFDLSSEIPTNDSLSFGGRVCFSNEGNGCLVCLDQISQEEVQQFSMTPEQKRDVKELYGVSTAVLEDSGPSVVTLNGVVASLAATEFLVQATGLRRATRLISYYGRKGIAVVSVDDPHPDCYYCKSVFGSKEKANVERYLAPS